MFKMKGFSHGGAVYDRRRESGAQILRLKAWVCLAGSKSQISENNQEDFAMGIKPGPKRIAKSTGKPDRRQRDNKKTPGNTPSLKPHHHIKGD